MENDITIYGKVTEKYARSLKIYMGNVSLESESYQQVLWVVN